MISACALCFVRLTLIQNEMDETIGAKPGTIHRLTEMADVILGIALLIIGICAMQFEFLPVSAQYAIIGVGATYLGCILINFLMQLKFCIAEEFFLFDDTGIEVVTTGGFN